MRRSLVLIGCLLLAASGCYESHVRPGDEELLPGDDDLPGIGPSLRPRGDTRLRRPERRTFPRPTLPPIECAVEPTPDCVASFPRVMIVMDGSSSMLAGRRLGGNNWDKARFALAGSPRSSGTDQEPVVPAFARELDVRGNVVTIEDVVHLGMLVFNAADTQQLVVQYTPCATDNLRWAMDPYTSCEAPGCRDPYEGEPVWTFKNSDVDRSPPFVETTFSFMPPCNPNGPLPCVGNVYNTYTAEGLEAALANVERYRRNPGAFELDERTRFANILITDGETAPDSLPGPALERLADAGVPTYVIGLEPEGFSSDPIARLEVLDRYAEAGGTELATLIEATERDIADAFAEAVTRIIDDLGTDPCCQPNHCQDDPEPPEP
jgi:hypothetical protein